MSKTVARNVVLVVALIHRTTGFAQVPEPGLPLPSPPPAVEPGGDPMWQGTQVIIGTGAAAMAQGATSFDFEMLSPPLGLGEQVVMNAPYSAEGVTEVVQTLADGNRIERRSTVQMARDSSGRTRREQGVAVIGSLVGGASPSHISVVNPVEHVTLIIDPSSRTVHKLRMPVLDARATEVRSNARRVEVRVNASGSSGSKTSSVVEPPPADVLFELPVPLPLSGQAGAGGAPSGEPKVMAFTRHIELGSPSRVEPLGTQVIEGVSANGTRTTMTIDAGAIGNEREITVVTERWFSPELQTLVLSRHSDPRMGETTYRLTNITRAEPEPSLFEAPADYTVVDGPEQRRVIIRRDERR